MLDPEHRAVGDEAQAGVVDEDGTTELLAELLDQELHLVFRHFSESPLAISQRLTVPRRARSA
jgi:hypothetical protein